MLRTGPNLLVLSLACCFLLSTFFFSPDWAQTEPSIAPWRVEEQDQVELLPDLRIDLNTASYDDLMQIPGMTPALAQAILDLRDAIGPFENFDDLLVLDDIDEEILDIISHFVEILQEEEKYYWHCMMRYQNNVPYASQIDQSPYRSGEKLTVTNNRGVSLGLAFEKDPGEEPLWDHSAFSLDIPFDRRRGDLILGDYLAGFGQGLVIRTRRNFGLSGNVDANLRGYPRGLRAYSSWDESIALRGAGARIERGPISAYAWGSQRYRDARLDSLGQITSFDLSGLHRTEAEEERKDACVEEAWGAHIEWESLLRSFDLAVTLSSVHWNRPYWHNDRTISDSKAGGLEASCSADHFAAEMEAAWDDRGNNAQIAILYMTSEWLGSSAALYHVDPYYFAPLASRLDFDWGEVSNREGLYSHLKVRISPATLSGFAHLYRYPRRLPGQSWGGQDFFLGGEFNFGAGVRSSLSSRWVQEEEEGTHRKQSRWRGRASLGTTRADGWRAALSLYLCTAQTSKDCGRMLSFKISKKLVLMQNIIWDAEVSAGLYRADDYSLRLYWVEYDASRSLRVRPLWGRGGILQLSTGIRHRHWGQLCWAFLWDQPEFGWGRSPSRTVTAIYRYP